ncbi:hypothetical protein D9758_014086 [Tetrapyrgos nigripes]|uniref:GST N-terminal domain-containing protein n=1 Tax=Tetrapyrgos nigripes TaxID=182062 RepID=A0A8H5FM24_9AGAR|nr:hypothetical protein D9758_014086 [Tetrapyrgos nigripes]
MADKTIILYDFPSKNGSWNAFVIRIRLALKYKGLPFKTVWIEYPDVESTLKAAGIPPTAQWPDSGKPSYTLPAIVDPSTGAALADSLVIAEYLDKAYPDKPLLMPSSTKALQLAFEQAVLSSIGPMFFQFILIKLCDVVNPASEEYFRRSRVSLFGKSVEDLVPKGESAKEEWKKLEAGFGKIAGWMKEDKFVMGDTVSFADFVIGGWIITSKIAWGEDSQEWKDIAEWHDGRWSKLVKNLEPYYSK